jgi:ABC-type transport system involved in resistance to organic solvents, auxiliary component
MNSKLLGCITGISILLSPSLLWADKPMDEIRGVVTNTLQIFKEPGMKSNDQRKEFAGQLEKIVDPIFDFRAMAKRSLGLHWRDLKPNERQEFVPLFRDFLRTVYLSKLGVYKGEKVLFTGETVGANYSEVDTKVVSKNGDEVPVVYMLKRMGGDWKVYDVVVDNVSIDNNYRSQFDRVISSSSYQELVKRIKQRVGTS